MLHSIVVKQPPRLQMTEQGCCIILLARAVNEVYVGMLALACINGHLSTNLEEEFGVRQQSVAHSWEGFGKETCEETCLRQQD